MKILVVGGAGYLGGALTDVLLSRTDVGVRVYDNLLYEDAYMKKCPFVFGDVRDVEALEPQLAWADAVAWLAALVGDGACAANPTLAAEVNEAALSVLRDFGGRIVFTSTASVYGAKDGVLDENAETAPLSVYGSTKLTAEKRLEHRNAAVLRFGTLFGLGDRHARTRFDLVVNTLVLRASLEARITVFGGEQFRPLLHVRDAADAVLEACLSDTVGVYNVCKQNIRIIDLAYQVRGHFPDIKVETTRESPEDTRNYRIDAGKARRELGLAPSWSIDQGIEELKSVLEEGRIKDPNSARYSNQKFLAEGRS